MSRPFEPQAYRPCVGVALFNAEGLVWIGRRRPDKGPEYRDVVYEWQMPQGGIDSGEDPAQAARRELYEETNIRTVEPLGECPEWYRYDLPAQAIGRSLKGRYRGQTQKWFALRFTGSESEINVLRPAEGAHKPEFIEWRWERLEHLPGLIVPFKRGVYERVCADFAPFAAR